LLGLPGVQVETTWDRRLGPFPLSPRRLTPTPAARTDPPADRLRVFDVSTPAEEERLFEQRCRSADAVLVVAPELDGALLRRRKLVDRLGSVFLGPSVAAVELFSDKLQTFRWLQRQGLPTVPTFELAPTRRPPERLPVVVKRRDGAGSHECQLVRSEGEWRALVGRLRAAKRLESFVWQPFVAGTALSSTVLVHRDGRVDVFPTGQQRLADDGTFRYQGGVLPASVSSQAADALDQTARVLCRQAPGLLGLAGVDWLLPNHEPPRPLVVDVNPRLTTSYVGYRRLAKTNLAARLLAAVLGPDGLPKPLRHLATGPLAWQETTVCFDPSGRVVEDP